MSKIKSYNKSDAFKESRIIYDGSSLSVGILALGEHKYITDKLLHAAVDVLFTHKIAESKMRIMWSVNGFALPLLAQSMTQSKEFDGIIVLGALIKDSTDKYYFETTEIYKGLMGVMTKSGIPVSPGLICIENEREAKRLANKKDIVNPGTRAAVDLVELMLA